MRGVPTPWKDLSPELKTFDIVVNKPNEGMLVRVGDTLWTYQGTMWIELRSM